MLFGVDLMVKDVFCVFRIVGLFNIKVNWSVCIIYFVSGVVLVWYGFDDLCECDCE